MNSINDNLRHTITNYMYLGLLPFFIGAFGPWILPQYAHFLTSIFLFYSGLILVFLAGALWAIGLLTHVERRPPIIHGAIAFSLWPLVSYFLPPLYSSLWLLTGFLVLLFWEKCYVNALYPEWYQKLRHKISFIVVACHMLCLWNILYQSTS